MEYFLIVLRHAYKRWKELLRERNFRISLLSGLVLFLISLYVNDLASAYSDSVPALSVGDLILDNIPTIDLTLIFTAGFYTMTGIIVIYPLLFRPDLAPFTAKTFAAFILIRSLFISLTDLGAPAGFYEFALPAPDVNFIQFFYINDLFFSGHTGMPFLAAFIFWDDKFIRNILIAISILMGITVLFLHVHYSIDVLGAYFITYSIFKISDNIFRKLNLSFRRIIDRIEARDRIVFRTINRLRKQREKLLGKRF